MRSLYSCFPAIKLRQSLYADALWDGENQVLYISSLETPASSKSVATPSSVSS